MGDFGGNKPAPDSVGEPEVIDGSLEEVDLSAAAKAAIRAHAHSTLSGVNPGDHHAKYLDSEAVTAMGAKADGNPLNHDRPTLLPNDRFFGYITSTITISSAGSYQDLALDAQPVEQGISWDAGDGEIDLLPDATYKVDISAGVDKTAGANSVAEIRALLNAAEIAGSSIGRLVSANNQVGSLSITFTVVTPAGTPKLKIQFGGGTTNTRLVPGAAIATTKPSLQITIVRLA